MELEKWPFVNKDGQQFQHFGSANLSIEALETSMGSHADIGNAVRKGQILLESGSLCFTRLVSFR